jgi:putative transcriptional regulator
LPIGSVKENIWKQLESHLLSTLFLPDILFLQKARSLPMPYIPIPVDREALTIMGVPFPDLATLESTAEAIGSQMFEGFTPTEQLIQFFLDWRSGKISDDAFIPKLQELYEK